MQRTLGGAIRYVRTLQDGVMMGELEATMSISRRSFLAGGLALGAAAFLFAARQTRDSGGTVTVYKSPL